MSFLSDLFGGGGGQANVGTTNVTTTGSIAPEAKPFVEEIFGEAQKQFKEDEFKLFPGPRIAEFDPLQERAFTGIESLADTGLAGSPDLASSAFYAQQAKDAAAKGLQELTPADIERLTNPFQQAVTDIEKREAIRQFESTIDPQISKQAVDAGAFGGSREAILRAEGEKNLREQLGDIQSKGSLQAYNEALAEFGRERQRQAAGATQYGKFAQQFPAQAARELSAVQAVGETKQARDQRALDIALSDFLTEEAFPQQQLGTYASLIRGFPIGGRSTREVQSLPSIPLSQQLMGLAGTGLAAYKAWPSKTGGQIGSLLRGMQSGGQIQGGGLASLERHQNNTSQRRESYKRNAEMVKKAIALLQRHGIIKSTGPQAMREFEFRMQSDPNFKQSFNRAITSVARGEGVEPLQSEYNIPTPNQPPGEPREQFSPRGPDPYFPGDQRERILNERNRELNRRRQNFMDQARGHDPASRDYSFSEEDIQSERLGYGLQGSGEKTLGMLTEPRTRHRAAGLERLIADRKAALADAERRGSAWEGLEGLTETLRQPEEEVDITDILQYAIPLVGAKGIGSERDRLTTIQEQREVPLRRGDMTEYFNALAAQDERRQGRQDAINYSGTTETHPFLRLQKDDPVKESRIFDVPDRDKSKYQMGEELIQELQRGARRDSRPPVDYMGPSYAVEEEEETVFEPAGPGGAGTRILPRRDYPALRQEGTDMRYPARTFEESLQEFEPAGPGGGRKLYDKVDITGILDAINLPTRARNNPRLPKELRGMDEFELRDLMETIRRRRGWKSSKIKRGPRDYSDPSQRPKYRAAGGLISLAPGGRTRLPMKAASYANVVENENVDVDETVFSGSTPGTKSYIFEQARRGRKDFDAALDAYKKPTPEETAHRELLKKRMTGLQDKQAQRVEEAKQGYWDALLEGSLRLMSEHSPEKGFLGNVASAFSGAPKTLAGVRKNIRDTKDAIEATELELANINANLTGQERKDALNVAFKKHSGLMDELRLATDIFESETEAAIPSIEGSIAVDFPSMVRELYDQWGYRKPTSEERKQMELLYGKAATQVYNEVLEKGGYHSGESVKSQTRSRFLDLLKDEMTEYWTDNVTASAGGGRSPPASRGDRNSFAALENKRKQAERQHKKKENLNGS